MGRQSYPGMLPIAAGLVARSGPHCAYMHVIGMILLVVVTVQMLYICGANASATPSDTFTVDESYTQAMSENHEILKDVITEKQEEKLLDMFQTIMNQATSRGIKPILAFGTLLGQARHGRRMPWDDDVDLMIQDTDVFDLVKGLPIASGNATTKWCPKPEHCNFIPQISNSTSTEYDKMQSGGKCCAWLLSSDVVIVWKPSGMPWKISPSTKTFPNIDVNTYFVQNDQFVVPAHQLRSGHVKQFVRHAKDMFPLSSVSFYGMNVSVPHNVDNVMTYLWGSNWARECVVTHNHHQSVNFYKMGEWPGLENPEANKYTKVKFPCNLMPEKYQGSYTADRINMSTNNNLIRRVACVVIILLLLYVCEKTRKRCSRSH